MTPVKRVFLEAGRTLFVLAVVLAIPCVARLAPPAPVAWAAPQEGAVRQVADAVIVSVSNVTVNGLSANGVIPDVPKGTQTIVVTFKNTGNAPATGYSAVLSVLKYPVNQNAYYETTQNLPTLAPGATTSLTWSVSTAPYGTSAGVAMVYSGADKISDKFFYFKVVSATEPTGTPSGGVTGTPIPRNSGIPLPSSTRYPRPAPTLTPKFTPKVPQGTTPSGGQ